MKLSRLLSIVKLGIDVLLLEHLQSRCIDSSMYRYTLSIFRDGPIFKTSLGTDQPLRTLERLDKSLIWVFRMRQYIFLLGK